MKKNYTYAFLTIILWSSMASIIKLILSDVPNYQAVFVSAAFASGFLILLNIFTGKIQAARTCPGKDYLKMFGLGFLGIFLYNVFYYYGLDTLTSQMACILNYLWPAMIMVFSTIFLKEPFTAKKVFAMVCSFIGVIILTTGGGQGIGSLNMGGIIACLGAAVSYGLYSVLNKKADMDQGLTMMVMWTTAAVGSLILGLITEDWVRLSGVQLLAMAYIGIAVDALAYYSWALALKGVKNTSRIANLAYMVPFLSVILSAIIVKETLTVSAIAALLFIVGGILVQSFEKKK